GDAWARGATRRFAHPTNHLRVRRGGEETAPAAIGPLAAPERAVGRRLGFGERHRLHLEQVVAVRGQPHALARKEQAGALAAAPFAGAIAQAPARNPAVVGGTVGGDEEEGSKDKRKPQMKSGHRVASVADPGTDAIDDRKDVRPFENSSRKSGRVPRVAD